MKHFLHIIDSLRNLKKGRKLRRESLRDDAKVCYHSGPQDRHSKRAKINDNILERWGKAVGCGLGCFVQNSRGYGMPRYDIHMTNIPYFIKTDAKNENIK